MKKIKKTKLFSLINLFFFFAVSKITYAQEHLIDVADGKYRQGSYQLSDVLVLIIRVSDLILRFVGSLALLFFIYGGLMFLLSSGNKEQVSKAKGIVKAAVIGLIIVFTSFIIISFALRALGVEDDWGGGLISI